jgi:hypothetical protein
MAKKILLYVVLITSGLYSSAQKISEKIVPLFTMKIKGVATDSFGLISAKPIPHGAFLYVGQTDKLTLKMSKLYNTFTWPSGEKLDFSKRGTARSSSGGVLDVYSIPRPGTSEVINLYVDPYHEGEVYIPQGLVIIKAASLNSEVLQMVSLIEEFNNTTDAFKDSVSKEKQARILIFLQTRVGLDHFFDAEIVNKLKGVNIELRGFLFRTYMFNNFLALSKGKDDNKEEGFKTMKHAYKNLVKVHPSLKNEELWKWLEGKLGKNQDTWNR